MYTVYLHMPRLCLSAGLSQHLQTLPGQLCAGRIWGNSMTWWGLRSNSITPICLSNSLSQHLPPINCVDNQMGRFWEQIHDVVRRIWGQFLGTNLEDLEETYGSWVVYSVFVYDMALPFNQPITASASLPTTTTTNQLHAGGQQDKHASQPVCHSIRIVHYESTLLVAIRRG